MVSIMRVSCNKAHAVPAIITGPDIQNIDAEPDDPEAAQDRVLVKCCMVKIR